MNDKWFCGCPKSWDSCGRLNDFGAYLGHKEFFSKKHLCWVKVCYNHKKSQIINSKKG